MENCIKCGAELMPGAVYCHACGKKQVAEKRKGRSRPNGAGNAYKRGKTWTARAAGYSYTVQEADGSHRLVRQPPTKGGFQTKTEALKWAAAQLPGEGQKASPTLLTLWQGWSENDMQKLSTDKQAGYKKARERLDPIISRKIDTLSIDDLQAVVNEQATSYYTARDMKSLLSHLYKRAMASNGGNGTVTVNLSRFIVLPELVEKEPEPFTEQEVNSMWEAWDNGELFVGYMLLMIYTSMMPGELFACKSDMIDYGKHEIYGCGRKTKKRKDTPIVFPVFMSPVIQRLAESASPETHLLYSGYENKFYEEYHATTKKLGIRDLPPYSCRHTTATEAVKKGVELPVVQQIMRHSKLASTQRYIHVSTEAAHRGVNQLEK